MIKTAFIDYWGDVFDTMHLADWRFCLHSRIPQFAQRQHGYHNQKLFAICLYLPLSHFVSLKSQRSVIHLFQGPVTSTFSSSPQPSLGLIKIRLELARL